jgi:aldehyde dehydrogenase (NAD+)
MSRRFFIDGTWVNPTKPHDLLVINPATEQPIATISLGTSHDVDNAVAATKAFPSFSETTVPERRLLLEKIIEV